MFYKMNNICEYLWYTYQPSSINKVNRINNINDDIPQKRKSSGSNKQIVLIIIGVILEGGTFLLQSISASGGKISRRYICELTKVLNNISDKTAVKWYVINVRR